MLKWDRQPVQQLLADYDYLTLHRVPGPRSFDYSLPIFLTFICLLLPPSKLSFSTLRYTCLPIILAIQLYIWQRHQSFDVISMQTTLTSFALLGWYDVRHAFKHLERKDNVIAEVPYPASLAHRIGWIATLIVSIQFTDYIIQEASHDAKQRSRKPVSTYVQYTQATAVRALFSFTLLDISSYVIQETSQFPCLTVKGRVCNNTWESILTDGTILFIHVYAAASFLLAHLPSLLILLAIGPFPTLRYHPSISPVVLDNLFSPVSSVWQVHTRRWGLRAFWGSFWHQNLRYVTVTPGVALAKFLNFPRRSFIWYMVITCQAFFWSGCIHAGMVPPIPLDSTWSSTTLRIRVASFFWLQPVGILFESMVDVQRGDSAKVAPRNLGRVFFLRLLALAWTSCFILVTLWATVLPAGRELGWWRLHPIPFSLTSSVISVFRKR